MHLITCSFISPSMFGQHRAHRHTFTISRCATPFTLFFLTSAMAGCLLPPPTLMLLLPLPLLIIHLVILILCMFVFCFISLSLSVYFTLSNILFLVALCSQFAYRSADLLIISKWIHTVHKYTHVHMYLYKNIRVKKKSTRGDALPIADQEDAYFLNSVKKQQQKFFLLSLSLPCLLVKMQFICWLLLLVECFAFAFYMFCLFIFQTINWKLLSATHI